jgi:hypothetical protein
VGTFHHDKGELHGLTIVVDTTGPEVWIGRCDTVADGHVVLLGADRHEALEGSAPKDEWIRQAARVGVFPRHPRIVLPLDQVARIEKLGDVSLS